MVEDCVSVRVLHDKSKAFLVSYSFFISRKYTGIFLQKNDIYNMTEHINVSSEYKVTHWALLSFQKLVGG